MSDRERPEVPPALQRLAAWSWRLLVVLTAAGLVLYLLIQLKVIVVPVIVALFLATLLVPLVKALEVRGWRHIWAVLTVFLGAVLLVAAIIAGFIPLIGNELDSLRQRADEGAAELQRWVASRPFGLSEEDLGRYLDQVRQRLTENSSGLTRGAVRGVTAVGEFLTGLILSLFLTFFFVKTPSGSPAGSSTSSATSAPPTCARSAAARPPRSAATCAGRPWSGWSTPSSSASGWPSWACPWSSRWPS
jgi:predicted PurR-regulated permease PerM